MNSVADEVKRCAALHFNGLARMVCQDERGNMIGRFVTPLSFPGVVWPRAAHRSKHVPTENPRSDVLHASLRPLIIDTSRAAFLAVHLLPRACGEEPLEQLRATNAKRIVETLARPSGVTIKRYGKRAYADSDAPVFHLMGA
jgi:hypothetical protein